MSAGEAAGFYSDRQSREMEKADMQVAYLELYCNMPALQLMQMHPPQKKPKKKSVISLGDSVAETTALPSRSASIPMAIHQRR